MDKPRSLLGMGLLAFVGAEVARLGLSAATSRAFEAGILPLPSAENGPWVEATISAIALTIATVFVLFLTFRYQLPEFRDPTDGLLVGLGFGLGALALPGLLELALALGAWIWPDIRYDDLQQIGFSERTSIKLGLKIMAWWERSPSETLLHALQWAFFFVWHGALGVLVSAAFRRKAWLGVAALLQAPLVALAGVWGAWAPLIYGAGAAVSSVVAWRVSKKFAKPANSAL